jgi:hypothetical protein
MKFNEAMRYLLYKGLSSYFVGVFSLRGLLLGAGKSNLVSLCVLTPWNKPEARRAFYGQVEFSLDF